MLGPAANPGAIPQVLSTCFETRLTGFSRLARRWAPRICLSPLLQFWDYKLWVLRTQGFMLAQQVFYWLSYFLRSPLPQSFPVYCHLRSPHVMCFRSVPAPPLTSSFSFRAVFHVFPLSMCVSTPPPSCSLSGSWIQKFPHIAKVSVIYILFCFNWGFTGLTLLWECQGPGKPT